MSRNINEITSKIWNMANDLRGSMDANEYKNYILGFLFYAYLSRRQEKYLDENLEPDTSLSINDRYKKAVEEDGLEDWLEDIAANLGYAISPENTWASLVESINNNDFAPETFQRIFESFDENLQLNQKAAIDLKGVFNDLNLTDSRLGNSVVERTKSLKNVVSLVDEINPNDEDGTDILGHIYQYLIEKFAASAGKKAGEFFTPTQISKILSLIVTTGTAEGTERFSVYDPAAGSGSLLLQVGHSLPGEDRPGRVMYYGQELNATTYNMARMNLMMNDVRYEDIKLRNGNSLEMDWPNGLDENNQDDPLFFDAVVENPPYSAKWNNEDSRLHDPRFHDYGKLAPKTKADFAFLLHGFYHLKNTGKMAIILPHGILFRGSAEGKIRTKLLEDNRFEAVIGLPPNLFYGTSIPTIIAVLSKNKTDDKVLFIDASKEFEKGKNQNFLSDEHVAKIVDTFRNRKEINKYSRLVDYDEIVENDFNLNIPRYVDTSEEEEEIDLQATLAELRDINAQIKEANRNIAEQLKILGVIDNVSDFME